MVLAKLFQGHIHVRNNLTIDKDIKGDVLEICSFIIPFDHVLEYDGDEFVEPVFYLGELFLVLLWTFLCLIELFLAEFTLSGEFFLAVFEGLFLVD